MKGFKIYLNIIIIVLISFPSTAQSGGDDDAIIAKGKGKREVISPKKKDIAPEYEIDTTIKTKENSYKFLQKNINTNFETPLIAASKIKVTNNLDRLYRGYARLSAGMYLSPLADVYFGSLRSKDENWGVNARHFSSNSSIKDVQNSQFSENTLKGYYEKINKDYSYKVSAGYNRNAFHLYGFEEDSFNIQDSDIEQVFNYINGKVSYAKTFDTSELNYKGDLKYFNTFNNRESKESNIDFDANFSKFYNNELFSIDFGVDYNNYKSVLRSYRQDSTTIDSDITQTNTLINLEPSILTKGDNWEVKVGLGIYADLSENNNLFHFYPQAQAHYSFFDGILVPFAGVTGRKKRNTFRGFSYTNPYIFPDLSVKNTNQKLRFYGGLRGALSKRTSFSLSVASENFEDLALFVNDTTQTLQNEFDVIYDNGNLIEITGELSYEQSDKLHLFLVGKFFNYSLDNQTYAWHLPTAQLRLGGKYIHNKKLYIRTEILWNSKRNALVNSTAKDVQFEDNTPFVELSSYLDMNLGFEYLYNSRISAFINFNNILSTRYDLWYLYPSQRINIHGGVTISF